MNKRIVLLIILVLIVIAAVYLLKCNTKDKPVQLPAFSLQGSSEINYGEIGFKIWDNEAEDGDTVRVYLDGKLVRDTLGLLNQPLELNFGKLSKGTHQLGVEAINEGSSAPATASIGLTSGEQTTEFIMNATLDRAASWTIIIK